MAALPVGVVCIALIIRAYGIQRVQGLTRGRKRGPRSMCGSAGRVNTTVVYVDELSVAAVWKLLRVTGLQSITVLERVRAKQKLLLWMLRARRVNVMEATFFAGRLRTKDGASVCRRAREIASHLSLQAARRIVLSERRIAELNDKYGRDTIRLFIAKQLHLHIEYWTLRTLVAQALCDEDKLELWLKKPDRFDHELLGHEFRDIDLCFYSSGAFRLFRLLKMWGRAVVREIAKTGLDGLGFRAERFVPPSTGKPSVLIFQEQMNIRADRRLRAQPHHWVSQSDPPEDLSTYLIETRSFNVAATEADKAQLAREGVIVLSASVFQDALNAIRNNATFERMRSERRGMIRAAFRSTEFAGGFFLLRVALLMKEAERLTALISWLNVKVFVTREPQGSLSDAMDLIAPELNVTTIAYQYSNMGAASTIMMSTADKFLVFGEMYKALYDVDDVAPREIVVTGYPYDGVTEFVRDKSLKHRELLRRAGASFVVCYFDEAVQHDRWGMVGEAEHLGELHALANVVLTDSTFGVVVKSQFMRYSPSQLYPGDELIRAAKATGRFLELIEGVHVNEIYPTEAALAADLCISHKFGATAGVESAIAGVRAVLLDAYGTKTLWDDVYAHADIEYKTMDALLEAIAGWRSGAPANQDLGDWSSIIHHFDPYRDGRAAQRLYQVVAQAVEDSESGAAVEKQPLAAYGHA